MNNVSKKSIEAAKKLIALYRSIDVDAINKAIPKAQLNECSVQCQLTGFGNYDKCLLCKSVTHKCDKCIYSVNKDDCSKFLFCLNRNNITTFNGIFMWNETMSPDILVSKFQARANHIEKLLETIEKDNEVEK